MLLELLGLATWVLAAVSLLPPSLSPSPSPTIASKDVDENIRSVS